MKPAYRVPSMPEINTLPWNGLKVASTFSGAGGSCLGYRMAGCKVVWANEFVPIAQESYRANASPGCYLDPRDIKTILPADILSATGLKVGEIDIFDGSPPCQAFSTAGKREKGWGTDKKYEHGASQKNETLFVEYIRLLRGLQPRAFIAENVSGLVKGTAKGFFLEILKDLKASGYRVVCKVLDAKWLGVPQSRQRTIFIGLREDLHLDPVHPKPLPYFYTVREALPWIVAMQTGSFGSLHSEPNEPSGSVLASDGTRDHRRNIEARMICGNSSYESRWGSLDAPSPTVLSGGAGKSGGFVEIQSGAFPKKYTSDGQPSPAVMAGRVSGLRIDTERRKFTIAELKRICAFPDDFILKGSYSQQWERLGNSVPPVMMYHIAMTVCHSLLRCKNENKN